MIDTIGYLAGFFLMLSFLPQVIKTNRTKSADGLSIAMLVISFLSGSLYEIYAYLLGLTPVVIMNEIFVALVSLQLYMTLLLRKKERQTVSS